MEFEGGWKQGGVRWELLNGVGHAYEAMTAKGGDRGIAEADLREHVRECCQVVKRKRYSFDL